MDDNFLNFLTTEEEDDYVMEFQPLEKISRLEEADSLESESQHQPSKKGKGNRKRPRRRKRMLTGVSKQRRAANERERKRLQIINGAFKELKHILPLSTGEENISKIEIVRLAATTIRHLSQILAEVDSKESQTGNELNHALDSDTAFNTELANDNNVLTEDVGLLPPLMNTNTLSLQDESPLGEVDLSFLLFSSDDMRLDSVDSGLEIPSPTISETSSSHDQLSFPFMEQDLLDADEEDVFSHRPTMIAW